MSWPKTYTTWRDEDTGYISVPFTWCLPAVRQLVKQTNLFVHRWVVGGPAIRLMPDYLAGQPEVTVDTGDLPGALQQVNPEATRTTTGCPNRCGFCAVPKTEGPLRILADWPDLPVICDNNLLAAPPEHFHRVMNRLVKHQWCDFNQGIDARLLTSEHAARITEVNRPMVRLALDTMTETADWEKGFDLLRSAGISKAHIRSYALIGYHDDPGEAWKRCRWIESHGVKALPMWYHQLDTMEPNVVTKEQRALGWNTFQRLRIMRWFYKHTIVHT